VQFLETQCISSQFMCVTRQSLLPLLAPNPGDVTGRNRTRGTRHLQLGRQWGPTVFGSLQLLQLAVIFSPASVRSQTSLLNLMGEGKKSREENG